MVKTELVTLVLAFWNFPTPPLLRGAIFSIEWNGPYISLYFFPRKAASSGEGAAPIYMGIQSVSEVHSKFESVEKETQGKTCYFMSFLKHKIQQKFNSAVKCQIGRSIC